MDKDNDNKSLTLTQIKNQFLDPLSHHKLYGGAQYQRTLSHFHFLVNSIKIDDFTLDNIALLLYGLSVSNHDGHDILHSVAKLSSTRIEPIMMDLLDDLARRIEYVLLRMWDLVEYKLLVRDSFGGGNQVFMSYSDNRRYPEGYDTLDEYEMQLEKDFMIHAKEIYRSFVLQKCQFCYHMVKEDLKTLFQYVSWDLAFGEKFQMSIISVDRNTPRVDGLNDDDVDGHEKVDAERKHNFASKPKNTKKQHPESTIIIIIIIIIKQIKYYIGSKDGRNFKIRS